ncbi:unnamed protein product [Gongylonema pulchrum]|uniref:Transmembrane protein n=1 Tax=Gongylonema pulchrum TaxID=637853 RepID=A0A183DCA4_9BILA|nr:unnamed protein product [Gongylonema pulchrum]
MSLATSDSVKAKELSCGQQPETRMSGKKQCSAAAAGCALLVAGITRTTKLLASVVGIIASPLLRQHRPKSQTFSPTEADFESLLQQYHRPTLMEVASS